MKYTELIKKIDSPVFSLDDLRLEGLKVYPYQLSEWTKKDYIIKLKNGVYAFSERKKEVSNEYISFLLYQPSYLSMEWALSRYGLIPEMVYGFTAVSTKTTRTFKNNFGLFMYRHVKKEMFFGYKKIKDKNQIYLIAEPEKAFVDYLYFNSAQIKSKEDVEELRFNEFELKKLSKKKIIKIAEIANNKSLNKAIELCFQ